DGAAGRPSGAEQQHAAAADRVAQVALDISDEGEAVEVLRHHAVAVELHAVDGAGAAGALRLLGRVGKRVELEGLRDVAAAPAFRPETVDGGGEPADGRLDRLVGEVLRRLPRELGVDL